LDRNEVSALLRFWLVGELGFDDRFELDARSVPTWSSPPSAAAGMTWIASITGGYKGWSAGRYLHASMRYCCISIVLSSTEGYIGSKVSSGFCEVLILDGVLFMEEYILLKITSSSSDDDKIDEEDEEGELVRVSKLDPNSTISMFELKASFIPS